LIDKHGQQGNDTIDLYRTRLAEVVNPKGIDSNSTQLNVIDQWLSLKNGEAVIADALDIIKPVFLAQAQKMFAQEAGSLLNTFSYNENNHSVLVYYMFVKDHPFILNSASWDYYWNFSLDKELYGRVEAIFPYMRPSHQKKFLMKNYGNVEVDPSLPMEEQMAIRTKALEEHRENIRTFEDNEKEIHKSFRKSSKRETEDY
jgi:hypothetical protein